MTGRMMEEQSLIAEIQGTLASGSPGKQAEMLRRVTDLFLAGAVSFSDEQVDLFDDVISSLAEKIETRARAALANRLAPVANAPLTTVRTLARDKSIAVAAPILIKSPRLTDEDLLSIAADNSQERLLAISKRATLSERVGDALVDRGNRDVVLSVTRNNGARFSDTGYGKLVDKSIDDEMLAICVGTRKDIPRGHFQTLISRASERVLVKLAASNPDTVAEVQQVLSGITGQNVAGTPEARRVEAEAHVESMRRSGKSPDAAVYELAAAGKFTETVIALSMLSRTSRELVESALSDRRGGNDIALLLAKAAGLSWPTAMQICILRRGPNGLPKLALEAARRSFERLQTDTAQRVLHFYNERHTAIGNFQRLAQDIDEKGASAAGAMPS
jgi:uncharacterized protein (DUF2336 family)